MSISREILIAMGVVAVVSLIPIWRVPGREGGFNAWEMIYHFLTSVEHIPVEQARQEACYIYYGGNHHEA